MIDVKPHLVNSYIQHSDSNRIGGGYLINISPFFNFVRTIDV